MITNNNSLHKYYFIVLLGTLLSLMGCKENYTPKPHGYLRIDMPKTHSYKATPKKLPFTSFYSDLAHWNELKSEQAHKRHSLWYNIDYKKYNAKVHLSYIQIENNLDSLLEESHKFAFEHTSRADAIDERTIHDEIKDVHCVVFNLKGNSASNMEFWATDSTKHFLRGALYLNTTPNVDSLNTIIDYIKEDINFFVQNIEWTCH